VLELRKRIEGVSYRGVIKEIYKIYSLRTRLRSRYFFINVKENS